MSTPTDSQLLPETSESFGDLLSQFERTHSHKGEADRQLSGTIVALSADSVFVDIGYKTEGILPLAVFSNDQQPPAIGDRLAVSSKGRNPEGYYDLSRQRVAQPKDWSSLEHAFAEKSVISGTVTAVVKGGLTVDVGVRAFCPASRSGARDAAEMEALVGQEIRCRITKLDAATEDVVVDRRAVSEEDALATRERRYDEVNPGDIVHGTVRSLTDFGAFIDLGGLDGLLHIGEIAWTRVTEVKEFLTVGQEIDVKVLKIEPETRRISLSLKHLQPHPWEAVPERYHVGDRVRGTVTRLTDFGAFLELEPGIEGLIHISEMSWGKKVRKPSDLLTVGDTAEAVILAISPADHRLSLGLKQAGGDPWVTLADRLAAGSVVAGEITSMVPFGAFVQLTEGVQGLVHISEIVADRRLNHPSDVLRVGEHIKAKVLEFDPEKRQLRLSIKALDPTGLDDFLAEHKAGDTVTGRVLSVDADTARIELGEAVIGSCTLSPDPASPSPSPSPSRQTAVSAAAPLDLSGLSSLLNSRWKTGTSKTAVAAGTQTAQLLAPGQIRTFTITRLEDQPLAIELKLAT